MKLKKCLTATSGLLLLSALCTVTGSSADSFLTTSTRSGQAQDLGHLSLGQTFHITLSLALKKEEDLDRDLADIYNPSSPNFHHFITPSEFKHRYTLDEAEANRTVKYLEQHGFHSVVLSDNGYLIKAVGTTPSVQQTFSADIHQYKDSRGRVFYAPTTRIVIPQDLHVEAIYGLDNSFRFHPRYVPTTPDPQPSDKPAQPGFSPRVIRKAYNFPESVRGKDQTLGLIELDGYEHGDISAYEKKYELPEIPLRDILIDRADGSAGYNAMEVVLDIEVMAAIAPDAKAIHIYEGDNSEAGILNVYSRITEDDVAKTISSSWGATEERPSAEFLKSENRLFKQMAMQGQSIFAASGDNGANDNGDSLSVDDPASQPYVTGVGGTHLNVDQDGNYANETSWTNGGGGVSTIWPIPSWQLPIAKRFSHLSSTHRNVPDVSLIADTDPGYSIYLNSTWTTIGGTSGAAPIWAAFAALVNERRSENGLTPLGFVNPALYAIAESPRYSVDFHDIKEGNNGGYPACEGPDNSSGLGSLNAAELLHDLSHDR